jgi:hypothetical protein
VQEQAREAIIIERVRRRLEEQEGMPLPQGRAPLGRKADGTMRLHTFDLVAENRSLIGEIRTYTLGESGGRPAGKFAHCYAACLYLFRSKARRKVLILTDQAFWSRFRRESDGIVEGIEDIHFARLGSEDVVRHSLVGRIVDAYSRFDEERLALAAARRAERIERDGETGGTRPPTDFRPPLNRAERRAGEQGRHR